MHRQAGPLNVLLAVNELTPVRDNPSLALGTTGHTPNGPFTAAVIVYSTLSVSFMDGSRYKPIIETRWQGQLECQWGGLAVVSSSRAIKTAARSGRADDTLEALLDKSAISISIRH